MSLDLADQSDIYAPSTPDEIDSGDESPSLNFAGANYANTSIDSSASIRFGSKDLPTTIQDSIQESLLNSFGLDQSYSTEESPVYQRVASNDNSSKRPTEDDSDLDETYDIRGRRLVSNDGDPRDTDDSKDESYQVIQSTRKNGNRVIRSSEENSAEVSESEEQVSESMGTAIDSNDSTQSPEDSFRFTATKSKLKSRNKIISSDESDGDASPSPQRSYRNQERTGKDIESDGTNEEPSPRFNAKLNPSQIANPVDITDIEKKASPAVIRRKSNNRNNGDFLEKSKTDIPHTNQLIVSKVVQDQTDGETQSSKSSAARRVPTPQTLRDALSKSKERSDLRNAEVLDLSDEIDDHSILEVSSTIASFSSPVLESNNKNLSIEEIPSSPEIVSFSPQELDRMRRDLNQKELLLKSCRLESLPDGGLKLKQQILKLKESLDGAVKLSSGQPKVASNAIRSSSKEMTEEELRKQIQMKKWALGSASSGQTERLRVEIGEMERRLMRLEVPSAASSSGQVRVYQPIQTKGIKLLPEAPKLTDAQKRMFADGPSKELYKKTESGYISAAARREAVSVTLDSLENLHRSLASCPGEHEKEPTPLCLTVPLLPHQERALKWLLWRETQTPAGGILADDMGLGKTLTMISLIVRQKELDPPPPASSDIWLSKTVKIKRSSGTLVVCPASVVGQWENEIKRRCKRNALSIVIFHGPDRAKFAAKLHQYDVVITTYQIVAREIPNASIDKKDGDSNPIGDFDIETHAKEIRKSVLLQIAFDRIILDEAHVIRNPKSGVSQSVCRLRAVRRWAVTGTPVQNKELDMYSLLRFLRVSPFDQLTVWKRWVDSSKSKNEQAAGRLQLLIKTLLLRRTKDQKTEGSDKPLVDMPSREVHTHQVELSREENEVYQKLLAFSRKALEDYIKAQENRLREGFTYNRGDLPEMPQKNVTKQMMLVLLLRLRQVCSHPALIKTMLDATDSESLGSEEAKIEDDPNDLDIISKMSAMTIDGQSSNEPKKEEDNFFTHTNPIFDQSNMSSKMRYIIDEVKKIIQAGQKAVVVSQWTSMLDVFAKHFAKLRIKCHLIAGNVPLKHRTTIVEDFNTNPDGNPVMLLSLGAGGVGLNLIGGNHLFLADMHWNPQLEAQACDRVYRVGQKKDVHVHRMVTVGTVEERILQLQQQKLAMANGILTGAAKLATKGLTIEDLKMLFNPGPPAYAPKPAPFDTF